MTLYSWFWYSKINKNTALWIICELMDTLKVVVDTRVFLYYTNFLSSPSLQEEVLPLLCALRCLHTWWAACNETKGEVWVEETFSTMVFNTCSLQVNMSIGKWVIHLTCKCSSVCIQGCYVLLLICLQHLLMLKHICSLLLLLWWKH